MNYFFGFLPSKEVSFGKLTSVQFVELIKFVVKVEGAASVEVVVVVVVVATSKIKLGKVSKKR